MKTSPNNAVGATGYRRLTADVGASISKSLSLSGSKQEGKPMALGHERLDVYRLAIGYVAWVYGKAATLEGIHRAARDQWLRASQSIPIPIPITIWMRASPGQSRDRTRSREGDEAVVYVYVNGYGDEGPHEPCRSADCMALTGCMSHPQF